MLFSVALASVFLWLTILVLPWRPWSAQERLDATGAMDAQESYDLSDLSVLIPARDEGEHIVRTLRAVACQGTGLQIVVVNDESSDDTAVLAQSSGLPGVTVVDGQAPPPGWTGKLWALEQGRSRATTEFVMLLDADIELKPGLIPALLRKMEAERLDFLSLMAELKMATFWECLLVPAFIFFFKLLYPFKISNDPRYPRIAAAAGGCILVRRKALEAIGGFGTFRNALIDDCSFALRIKKQGFRTWIGLTRSIISQRHYDKLATFWNMVARTAYSQLQYSPWLLGLCSMLMALCFLVPLLALVTSEPQTFAAGALALLIMVTCYLPVLRYYERFWVWAFSLPLAGLLFIGMTWTSAWRYSQGERSSWKGRRYKSGFTS